MFSGSPSRSQPATSTPAAPAGQPTSFPRTLGTIQRTDCGSCDHEKPGFSSHLYVAVHPGGIVVHRVDHAVGAGKQHVGIRIGLIAGRAGPHRANPVLSKLLPQQYGIPLGFHDYPDAPFRASPHPIAGFPARHMDVFPRLRQFRVGYPDLDALEHAFPGGVTLEAGNDQTGRNPYAPFPPLVSFPRREAPTSSPDKKRPWGSSPA